jgi:hypothetical protein
MMMIILYFGLKTLMTVLVAKSGANVNYLMEWMLVAAVFIGPAVRDVAERATGNCPKKQSSLLSMLVPVAIGLQALAIAVSSPDATDVAAARQHRHELDQLSDMVRAAPGPVISDDMVMLLRSGKRVLWEPAIFGELASTGAWDERPFVSLIRDRHFSFFITEGDRGDPQFDLRYTPGVAAALDQAYPRRCRLAGYIVHLPAMADNRTEGCRPLT